MQTATEPRVFYSRAANLMVNVRTAQRVIDNGVIKQVDSKIVEFVPQGDKYGRYVTSDPEEISALVMNPRVLTPAQYIEETTPAETRIQLQKDETIRVMEENNRLVQKLQQADAEKAELERKLRESSKPK